MADATLKDVMAFFDMTAEEVRREWKLLTDADKADIKRGIGDGTLTY